jgi:hypothetical protein
MRIVVACAAAVRRTCGADVVAVCVADGARSGCQCELCLNIFGANLMFVLQQIVIKRLYQLFKTDILDTVEFPAVNCRRPLSPVANSLHQLFADDKMYKTELV